MSAGEHGEADEDVAGMVVAKAFGVRRLKALLLLTQHEELDDEGWHGMVELHFGGKSVKGAVKPAATEIRSTGHD